LKNLDSILLFMIFLVIWPVWAGWAIIYGIKGGLIDRKIYNYRSKRYETGRDARLYGLLHIVGGVGSFAVLLDLILRHHLLTRIFRS
jgi:hypothetical protein